MLLNPATHSRAIVFPERRLGCPTTAIGTAITAKPSIMTQARVDLAPISRLELDAHNAAMAKPIDAPSPPRIPVTRRSSEARVSRGSFPALAELLPPIGAHLRCTHASPPVTNACEEVWCLRARVVAIGQFDLSFFGPGRRWSGQRIWADPRIS